MPNPRALRLLSMLLLLGMLLPTDGTARTATARYTPPPVERSEAPLSGSWKFLASNTQGTSAAAVNFNDSSWKTVTVPHTWNSRSDRTQYSNAWYRTRFTLPAGDAGKRVYITFGGVSTVADVYINGQLLGQHRGAYTRFIFDITDAAVFGGENVLAVKVTNRNADSGDLLPSGSGNYLYFIYGGIYRTVGLLTTDAHHIDPTHYASTGVYITQSQVSAASARLRVETKLRNTSALTKTFTVRNVVVDADGAPVLTLSGSATLSGMGRASTVLTGTISAPTLWGPANPYLYRVHTELLVDGVVRDLVTERIGLRYYLLTPTDFTLNGVSMPLRGIGMHQESEYKVTAITDDDLRADWDTLVDLGVNLVRLSHYPHAEYAYDLSDERGLLVWIENGHTTAASGGTTGDRITTEMVYQNFNHPSIIFWGAGNEANLEAVARYARVIESLDTSRPTAYGSLSNTSAPLDADYTFRNIYPGWGGWTRWQFGEVGTRFHYISEAGAGGVITHHQPYTATTYTRNVFEPEEYQQLVIEAEMQQLFYDPATVIPAFSLWIFRDFGINYFKNINTKGVMTYASYKKDVYYLYKAFLRPNTPMLHLVGPHYVLRGANQGIKVYSNAQRVTLTVNGVQVGERTNGSYTNDSRVVRNVFLWQRVLQRGRNVVSVRDERGLTESMVVYYIGSGAAAPEDTSAAVVNLTSSNPSNPAYYINRPLADEYPVYYRDDRGNTLPEADNTFAVLPPQVDGATWISTKRQSDPGYTTNLNFQIRPGHDATVYIMHTKQVTMPTTWITDAGFSDTGVTGKWRDNNLNLVDYRLFSKAVSGGDTVSLGSSAIDFVVLIKARPSGGTTTPTPTSTRTATPTPTAATPTPSRATTATPTDVGPNATVTPTNVEPSATPTRTATPTPAINLKINFQPAGAPVPAGYLADTGAAFGARGNGHSYGWNADNSANTRDRNATNSPDQRYDSFAHMQLNGSFWWEVAVPNGSYRVRLVCGDPLYYDSVYRITAEGVLLVDGTPTSAGRWVEGSGTVTVRDGVLSIVTASGAINNKLAFIEVSQVP